MASTLSAQLNKLQANRPSTTSAILDPKKLKTLHSVSLLFTPRHAATQDFDTLHSICLEGFHELCSLDPRFEIFERSLFSEQSKSVDRELLGQEENGKLDDTIKTFLRLLGAWALVRSGVKALEWLVRRFRVHYHNTDLLLLAFLPYHQHPFFLRLLSILPQPLPTDFLFLAPYRKAIGTPIPKSLIVQALSTRQPFFNALANHVLSAIEAKQGHTTLVRFWAGVSIESVGTLLDRAVTKGKTSITEEDVVTQVLPVISDALKAGEKNAEFQIGTYMLLTLLSSRVVLEDQVVKATMESVTATWTAETVVPAIACLSLLAQQRDGTAPEMPARVTKRFLKITNIADKLLELGGKYRADKLSSGLCVAILKNSACRSKTGIEFVRKILQRGRIHQMQKREIVKTLVDVLLKASGASEPLMAFVESLKGQGLLEDTIKENGGDLELLELRLGMVLIESGNEVKVIEAPDAMDVDLVEDKKETSLNTKEVFEQKLSLLPKTATEKSFLQESTPEFAIAVQAFLAAAAESSTFISEFTQNSFFEDDSTLRLSFLLRCCNSRFPALGKEIALNQIEKIISAQKKTTDYQAFIPHILAACAEPSQRVRKAATSCLTSLNGSYQSADKKGKKDTGKVLGFDIIYGKATDNVKWLSFDETKKVVEAIASSGLEECALDDHYIYGLIGKAISRVKSNLRQAFIAYFTSHIVSVPGLRTKTRLLAMINTMSSASKTDALLPILEWWMKLPAAEKHKYVLIDKASQQEFEEQLFKIVDVSDRGDGLKAIVDILAHPDTSEQASKFIALAGKRLKELWQTGLREELKPVLAKELLAAVLDDASDVASAEALDVLRDVEIASGIYEHFLVTATNPVAVGASASGEQSAKRQKLSGVTGEVDNARQIKMITVVLELLEGDHPERHPELLGVMFSVLGRFLEMNETRQAGGDYMMQVLLSCLSGIVAGFKTGKHNAKVDGKSVRADMLVSCIRSTNSPQVQNSALLLVASLADLSPEVVLHSVMPIFTFMGANTLRQDDEYSAHVIEQTIQRVIPPLVASLKSPVLGSAELLRSFIAAFGHIPTHRRLKLFVALTKTLGAEEFLYALLAMLGGSVEKAKMDGSAVKEFCVTFCGTFGPHDQLNAIAKYLDAIVDVTKSQPGKLSEQLFDVKGVSLDERVRLSAGLLGIAKDILSAKKLQSSVIKGFKTDLDAGKKLKDLFSVAVENCLELGQQLDSTNAIDGVLQSLLALVPTPDLVDVVEGLLSKKDFSFQSSVLSTLKMRISTESKANKEARAAIMRVLPTIAALITSPTSDDVLKADALSCLAAVTTRLGSQEPDTIAKLADTIISDGALRSSDEGLQILSLICLGSMTKCLGGRIIPVLPKVAPYSLDLLESKPSWQVHNAVYVLLDELVKTIPNFMSSYLERMLKASFASAGREEDEDEESVDEEEDESKNAAMVLRNDVLSRIANNIDAKIVLTALTSTWPAAVEKGVLATQELFSTLKQVIDGVSKSTVMGVQSQFSKFFLQAFDLRRTSNFDKEDIAALEEQCFKTVVQMVFKLNDTTFRPMFSQFLRWANALKEKDEAGRKERLRTFYDFLNVLLENLSSIVTSYYGIVLDNAVELLSELKTKTGEENLELWETIIKTLIKSFANDQDEFWQTPAQFDRICPTLLSQLENASILPIARVVVPAIAELAVAAQSEDVFKTINAGVLKHMRAEDSSERLAAVKLAMEIYDRLGEEWLAMLPETIPIIAELLEDDDETVERETQRLIVKIEGYLGESLDSMLT